MTAPDVGRKRHGAVPVWKVKGMRIRHAIVSVWMVGVVVVGKVEFGKDHCPVKVVEVIVGFFGFHIESNVGALPR